MHGHSALTKHVDKIQIGRNKRLERAVGHQGLNGAVPVALAGARQADAPLVHAQDLGAEDDLVLIDKPLGSRRPQELYHLDRSQHAVLLAMAAEPRACQGAAG